MLSLQILPMEQLLVLEIQLFHLLICGIVLKTLEKDINYFNIAKDRIENNS